MHACHIFSDVVVVSHSVVLTLCDPMDCSMLGFPILHYLPEFAQTHVHWVGDAIQLSYPLLSPSPPALSLSQHQGIFQRLGSLHQVAKVLEFQHQPFQWVSGLISFRIDWFDLLAVQGTIKNLLQHQFESVNSPAVSLLYGPTLISVHDHWKNHSSFDYMDLCWQSNVSAF